jgi:hypothetical protein
LKWFNKFLSQLSYDKVLISKEFQAIKLKYNDILKIQEEFGAIPGNNFKIINNYLEKILSPNFLSSTQDNRNEIMTILTKNIELISSYKENNESIYR